MVITSGIAVSMNGTTSTVIMKATGMMCDIGIIAGRIMTTELVHVTAGTTLKRQNGACRTGETAKRLEVPFGMITTISRLGVVSASPIIGRIPI